MDGDRDGQHMVSHLAVQLQPAAGQHLLGLGCLEERTQNWVGEGEILGKKVMSRTTVERGSGIDINLLVTTFPLTLFQCLIYLHILF